MWPSGLRYPFDDTGGLPPEERWSSFIFVSFTEVADNSIHVVPWNEEVILDFFPSIPLLQGCSHSGTSLTDWLSESSQATFFLAGLGSPTQQRLSS